MDFPTHGRLQDYINMTNRKWLDYPNPPQLKVLTILQLPATASKEQIVNAIYASDRGFMFRTAALRIMGIRN